MAKRSKLKVMISSTMTELRDVREIVKRALAKRGISAFLFEQDAGAQPNNVLAVSLRQIDEADVYVGLFYRAYGEVTVEEYKYAHSRGKPCLVYIRDKNTERDPRLEQFLHSEVYDLKKGVTYDYFDSAIDVGSQIANDTTSWLVRGFREATAALASRVSDDERTKLEAEANRIQSYSRQPLPVGSAVDNLAQNLRGWFTTLGYGFERHEIRKDSYFEWIINVDYHKRYERIVIRGIEGEGGLPDLDALRHSTIEHGANGGWLIAHQRISQAARDQSRLEQQPFLNCYTFDELIDEDADFSGYLAWLEAEVKTKGIDKQYVPLACTKDEYDNATGKLLGTSKYDGSTGWVDGFIDRWLDDPSMEHLSILGEFGTGKTWVALHYAWTLLLRYRDAKARGIERPRLPLYIPLRDYAKAVSVESLFSEFFFRKHEVPLSGYSAFEQLNRMGKLLLIFDGFDEMASKIDRQLMINNFWELARVVVPGSKAILTCRSEHFPDAKEGRALLNAELQASTSTLSGEPPQFEVLELSKLDDSQIRTILMFRASSATVDLVMHNSQLLDLTRRPVMADIVIEALPDIEAGKVVDLGRVYLYAVRRKMEKDIRSERTFTSMADKLYFLCEVSYQMLLTSTMSMNYRAFPDRLKTLFGPVVQEQKDLDHWHFDMMGQTLLIRNAEGDYMPAHRSLLEFFAAYKFAAELGILADDFIDLARNQSHIDPNKRPTAYKWSSYFYRQLGLEGKVLPIAPLAEFDTEEIGVLAVGIGGDACTPTVLRLLQDMIGQDRITTTGKLVSALALTKGRSASECGRIGANVARLLLLTDVTALKGLQLDTAILNECVFDSRQSYVSRVERSKHRFELSHTNFRGAELKDAYFGHTPLANVNLSKSDLTGAEFALATLNGGAISTNGSHICLLTDHETLILNASNFKVEARSDRVGSLAAYSLDSKLVAISDKHMVEVFDVLTLQSVVRYQKPGTIEMLGSEDALFHKAADITSILLTSDSSQLLVGCRNGCLFVYDTTRQVEGTFLARFDSAIQHMSADPNGETITISLHGKGTVVMNLKSQGSFLVHNPRESFTSTPSFSHDEVPGAIRVPNGVPDSNSPYAHNRLSSSRRYTSIWANIARLSHEGSLLAVSTEQYFAVYSLAEGQKGVLARVPTGGLFPSVDEVPFSLLSTVEMFWSPDDSILYVLLSNGVMLVYDSKAFQLLACVGMLADCSGSDFRDAIGLHPFFRSNIGLHGGLT